MSSLERLVSTFPYHHEVLLEHVETHERSKVTVAEYTGLWSQQKRENYLIRHYYCPPAPRTNREAIVEANRDAYLRAEVKMHRRGLRRY